MNVFKNNFNKKDMGWNNFENYMNDNKNYYVAPGVPHYDIGKNRWRYINYNK